MQQSTEQLRLERVQLFKQQSQITKKLIHLDIEIAKRIKHETRALTARSYVN